jgi:hypothetical protein
LVIAAGVTFVACDDDGNDNNDGTILDDSGGEISTVGDDDAGTMGDGGSIPPVVTSAPAGTNPVVPNPSASP